MPRGIEPSTRPSSSQHANNILSKIREQEKQKWEDTPDDAKDELEGLREVTTDTLDNPSNVFPELLQNADDIGGDCSKVTIQLTEDALVFRNHKEPMSVENVEALGAFTKSTKRGNLDLIGHFGIGFKTVFSMTDSVHIHSGFFSFKYSKDAPTVPIPVEYQDFPIQEGEYFDGTTVVLPFTQDAKSNRRNLLEEQIENVGELLPFLNNIDTIDLEIHGNKKSFLRELIKENDIRVIKKEHGERIQSKRIRLFSESFYPDDALLDQLAEKRHLDATALHKMDPQLDITLGIPIDDTGAPKGTNESHLFCYFPTDPNTQLPFDIQADFSLKPDRKSISWPDEFNKRLLQHVSSVFQTAFIEFHNEQIPPSQILEIIPDLTSDRPEYLEVVVEEIINFLQTESCIPNSEGNLFKLSEITFLEEPFRSLFTENELGQLLGRTTRYPSDEISDSVRERLHIIVPNNVIDGRKLLLASVDSPLYQSKIGNKKWLIEFMAGLNEYWNSKFGSRRIYTLSDEEREAKQDFLKALERVPFLLLENGTMSSFSAAQDGIYRLPESYSDDYKLFTTVEKLNLLSEELLSMLDDPDDEYREQATLAKNLLFNKKLLSIPTLDAKDVVRKVINPEFDEGTVSPERADQFILFVSKRPNTLADVANIKLQTSDSEDTTAEFRSPNKLYLGSEYINTYDTETIFDPFSDLSPISSHYLNLDDRSKQDWVDALADMGVKRRIEVVNQDPKESARFTSEEEVRGFLADKGDQGKTEIHDEDVLSGYNGKTNKWSWMKRSNNNYQSENYKYALIDRFLPENSKEVLNSLTNKQTSSTDPNYWREFLKMLNEEWDNYYKEKSYYSYRYSVKSSKYQVKEGDCYCPSTFGKFLQNKEWAPGTDGGLHLPRDLFVRNNKTEGKPVTFIDPEPTSQSLIEFLDLRKYPGIQVTVNTLQKLIGEYRLTKSDPDNIEREIRSELWAISREIKEQSPQINAHDREAIERLKEIPFIYVENADPPFRTPSEVTWKGPALGEYLVPISSVYTDFESLFTDTLEMNPEPTLENCISFLGTREIDGDSLNSTDNPPWNPFQTAWQRILQDTVYLSRSQIEDADDLLGNAIELLKKSGRLPTAAETVADLDTVQFHTTDLALLSNLPKEIQKQVLHPWRDERYKDEIFSERIERLTGTKPLENSLDSQVVTDIDEDNHIGSLYSEYQQLLNTAYSYFIKQDEPSNIYSVITLAQFPLYQVPTLSCKYTLADQLETTTDDIRCMIDSDRNTPRIILTSDGNAGFALVDAIVQEFQLTRRQSTELAGLLKGAFGKPDSLLEAYLADSSYEYQRLPEESLSSQSTDPTADQSDNTNQESKTNPAQHPGSDTDDEATKTTGFVSASDNVDENGSSQTVGEVRDNGASSSSKDSQKPEADTETPRSETEHNPDTEPETNNPDSNPSNTQPIDRPTDHLNESENPQNDPMDDESVESGRQAGAGSNPSAETPSQSERPNPGSNAPSESRNENPPVAEPSGSTDQDESDEPLPPREKRTSTSEPTNWGSSGGNGGGGGAQQSHNGALGEEFVFTTLQETVERYFEKEGRLIETTTSTRYQSCTILGVYDGNEYSIEIADVSHHNCGYDIELQGATLTQNSTDLSIANLDRTKKTPIEVKSTKGHRQRFTLSPNEYWTAIQDESRYTIVRIHTVVDKPTIDRIFYKIPKFYEQIENIEYRPNGIQIRYSNDSF